MIGSLFIVNGSGEILIEKHWKGVVPRTVVDEFWGEVSKQKRPDDVLPIIETPQRFLVHVLRHGLYFLAILTNEAEPLLVLELLHRFVDVLEGYFRKVAEETIREHFVLIYQLLEEFIDNGFPMTTEPAVLKELVPPPSIGVKIRGGIGSASSTLPSGTQSAITWRKQGLRYSTNEIFFDIVEEVDAIVDTNGMMLNCEVNGRIDCRCKLSGMPDVLLTFVDSSVLDNCSLHPCVRYARFETDRALSFIPPDGEFTLLTYRVGSSVHVPLYVKPQVSFNESGGRLHIMAGVKQTSLSAKGVEDVSVTVPLPAAVDGVSLESQGGGSYRFDRAGSKLVWEIGKLTPAKSPSLNGTLSITGSEAPDVSISVSASFKVPLQALSGLKVDCVTILSESYKAFKGVRAMSRSGNFQIRT